MLNRLRLLKGATALLYFGPLLAGLGGFGWAVVPVFAAIFLLWLVILRPNLWPRVWAEWTRPEALITLAAQTAVQVLLVTLCFGVGRGIGGVLGALPPFPLMLPIAVSFLSIPLCRMIWNPAEGEALDGFLDQALAEVQGVSEDGPDALRARTALAGRMVAELTGLPEDTTPEVLAQHLRAMAGQVDHASLRAALMDPIYDGSAGSIQWRAAIVHATEPEVVQALAGETYARSLFAEVTVAEHLALFADRCQALLVALPGAVAECPEPADVRDRAKARPKAAKALMALAEALAPPVG